MIPAQTAALNASGAPSPTRTFTTPSWLRPRSAQNFSVQHGGPAHVLEDQAPALFVATHPDSGIHFRELGSVVDGLDYGHIGFDLNVMEIRAQFTDACGGVVERLQGFEQKFFELNQTDQGWSRVGKADFMKSTEQRVHTLCQSSLEDYDEALALFFEIDRAERAPRAAPIDQVFHHLEKRQVLVAFMAGALALAGLYAIGSMIFGNWKLLDLSAGINLGSSDELIETIQEHEKITQINKKAISDLTTQLARLENDLSSFHELMEKPLAAYWAIHKVREDFSRITEGIRAISQLKFPSRMIPPSLLLSSVKTLKRKMDLRGIDLLPTQAHEFYNLDVSFLYFRNHTLRVFLHVPAYSHGGLLSLYEYLPTPVRLADKWFLPTPPETHLIIDSRSQATHRPLSASEFSSCRRTGVRFYCPGNNYLFKAPKTSCLSALHLNSQKEIAEMCSFKPLTGNEGYIRQVTPHEFLLYQPLDGLVTVSCPNQPDRKANFQGVRVVTVPASCRANSKDFSFQGEVDILVLDQNLSTNFHISRPLNLSSFFPDDLVKGEMRELERALSEVGSPQGVKVRDLVSILKKARTARMWHWGLGLAGTIGLCVAIVCCCCLACSNPEVLTCGPCKRWWRQCRVRPRVRGSERSVGKDETELEVFTRDQAASARASGRSHASVTERAVAPAQSTQHITSVALSPEEVEHLYRHPLPLPSRHRFT